MGEKYVVKEGDSLSKIGQERWKEIYRENRSKIGEDPNVIKPGQELAVPAEIFGPPEVSEMPASTPTDEYVAIDPYQCMLQSCEIDTCDRADTFYMPAYWRQETITGQNEDLDSIALECLSAEFVSDAVAQLFKLASETDGPFYTNVSHHALKALKERASKGELSVAELKFAAAHKRDDVRKIAATDGSTPTDILFELAGELDGPFYTYVSDHAVESLKKLSSKGKFSENNLKTAAEHKRMSVREIAIAHIASK
jgi:hypothetical protein